MALNPIAFTEDVVSDFLRYQLTTYPLADTDLHAQMRALLQLEESRITPLRRGPFISLSRPFKPGASMAQLVAEGVFHSGMKAIATYPSVRAHQEQAFRSIKAGRTTLVATGTGSGKTECFLYPVISRCLELADAGTPPGIVAVLVYPMNALAEDQLDRLRGLLAGRGIPFGMYVGKTPETDADVRAERMPPGSSNADYHARLKQLREHGEGTTLIPAEERASRASMREPGGQPRILLSNVKQMELLLTRGKDVGLFDNAPLEFLVFDEAHTFRGAQGAETACLIRRLRAFAGKDADGVTCVATSATMADPLRGPKAPEDFARRFFGVDAAKVTIVGEIYDELSWAALRKLPTAPPKNPAECLKGILAGVDLPEAEVAAALSHGLVELSGMALTKSDWQLELAEQLSGNQLVYELAALLRTPRALKDIPEALKDAVGREVSEHEVLAWLALGAACGVGGKDPLLRPVVHSFIRGVGGAVVTLSQPANLARLWLAGEDADAEMGDKWCRFPLFTCTTCGQHYYETWVQDFALEAGTAAGPQGGDLVGSIRLWPHLARELEGDRVLFVDRLVVRPDEDDEAEAMDEDDAEEAEATKRLPGGHEFEHKRLVQLWVCRHCGSIHGSDAGTCGSCQTAGGLVPIQAVRTKKDLPGLLHSCVACQAPGRRPGGGRYREPARPVRASAVSDVHVLAQSMVHLSERPRLLVFADNRQDAAFQAGWMKDHARRFRLRALMSQAIQGAGVSVGDVAQHIDALLEGDRELSRALLPEVWQVAPQDDAGVKHREERLYFLRLQVLREVATGVKQRVGLEPWGRIQVDYLGLDPNLEPIQRWAAKLRTTPLELREGIAALLDHHRRLRVLFDEHTKIFSKFWRDGDKEIQYGYLPKFSGGPKGLKLSRGASDDSARVLQWVGQRPTQVSGAVQGWGVGEDDVEAFLEDVWKLLREIKVIVPAVLQGWGSGGLPGSAGSCQVDAGKLRLVAHTGRWRCEKCRRTTVRRGPTSICMAWRCGGKVAWEASEPDNFDLHVLDGNYRMLRVAEHSAQVPSDIRERIENQFKGEGEQINAFVCTPTLELGVDIGGLDAVLMRNVPPSAANYWQRAGRAGRRHRMAVDVTYAQPTGFDQTYFRDPLRLLNGAVEPPRFNLKNELMVGKHVHACVLTALHGVARRSGETTRQRIEEVLTRCFPSTLKPYLFTPAGEVRPLVQEVSELGALIQAHRSDIVTAVNRAFTKAWPAEDYQAVRAEFLASTVDEMSVELASVIGRFKRRLDWARGELSRLAAREAQGGALDPEDKAHRYRCTRLVERFKGQAFRRRAQAQGGSDDSDTMGALAREGFFPGYGLESGSIIASAEPPRMSHGIDNFELPRAPGIALREYVPGNAIYANGFRFVPRHFQLVPEETMRFRVDPEHQVVQEVGSDAVVAPLGEQEIRAVPVCDVIMPSQAQISDEEDFRFQMSVAVYGLERGFHLGGTAWKWGELDLRSRKAVQLRMVNVGPRKEVEVGSLGYELCLACGQSHSPFASQRSHDEFLKKHLERCGHRVEPTGFFADLEVDVLGVHDVEDPVLGFSFMEAVRMGAAKVLEMEVEDLQIIGLGRAGEKKLDILLHDPMPGGSGLLEQLVERWEEVREAALEIVEKCPGACERACIDCLHTYRNRFYHEHLDRHRAAELLRGTSGPMKEAYPIPEKLPKTQSTAGQAQTPLEVPFKRFLEAAGLPTPEAQKKIQLGEGVYTVPDFFYSGEDASEPGICIYTDGMSTHIHGNDEQAAKDKFLREKARSLNYEVVEVPSFEVDDEAALVAVVARIAKYLVGKERAKAVREDTSWVERAKAKTPDRSPKVLRLVRSAAKTADSVPIVDLKAAAGAFSAGQAPAEIDWGRIEGLALRPGLFVAQVVGDSMDQVVPSGSWCLWEHFGALGVSPPAAGDLLIVRRRNEHDPEFGEFTFKQLMENEEERCLVPRSDNSQHKWIRLRPTDELAAVARFVAIFGSVT